MTGSVIRGLRSGAVLAALIGPPARAAAAAPSWPVVILPFDLSPATLSAGDVSTACAAAALSATQLAGLPTNLLLAIGIDESGRTDPLSGATRPWPWTINVDGVGHFFDDKASAINYVRLARASGAHSIDVGCFQISLLHHPDAFASLDDAFDPAENAAYAAGFLNRLHDRNGGWAAAIAAYHSATTDLGLPYERHVLATWQGLGRVPADLGAVNFGPATPDAARQIAPDLVVVMQSKAARLVRVITPDTPPASGTGRLPKIFSP